MYEFREEDAYEFARVVGIQAKKNGDNLQFIRCPYCNGGQGGRDRGTFAISLRTGAFNCLRNSCGVKGNMITLHKDFQQFSLGDMVDEYYKPKRQFVRLKQPADNIIPKPRAIEYQLSRGISEEITRKYQITSRNDNPDILAFPHFDENEVLQCVKYRNTKFEKGKTKGSKEFFEKNTKPILFGMNLCSGKFESLCVTEGQEDCLAVAEAFKEEGIDVVSVPGGCRSFTFVPYCWNWLSKFKEIIIFGDYERGEITLLDEFSKRLKSKVKHVREEDYKDCKDANDILLKYGKEQVIRCVENAVFNPIERVVDIADVQSVDMSQIEFLHTGLKDLDDLMQGGLPFGYLTLLAGLRGKGKSCLASQIITKAIEQNYTTFIYSGELTRGNCKEWLDRQIAGQDVTEEYTSSGYIRYKIRNSIQEQLNEFYRGKCYLYDNSMVDDEEEDLLNTIEEVICKYGVRVILVDNLMTAMDSFDSKDDKWEKQSKFVKASAKIAQKYNVVFILVAHKRKANGFQNDENDEVSGSADITNLAGIVIAYDVNNEETTMSEYPRVLKILKNRLTGHTNLKGYLTKYDERSKRIFGDRDDKNHDYGYKRTDDGFFEQEDTPFY